MQEVFYEESAKTQDEKSSKVKFYIIKIFSVISYVFAGLSIIFFINIFDFSLPNIIINLIISLIPFALFLFLGIFLGKIKDRFYVDYDYTFVSGSIRLSKVINNSKRRNVCTFDAKQIEKIGVYDSNNFKRLSNSPDVKVLYLSSNNIPLEGKGFYYIYINIDNQKIVYVLECTKVFITYIVKCINRTCVDEEVLK